MTIENDLPNGTRVPHLARTCAIADVRIFQVSALDKALRGVNADKGPPRPVPSSTLRRVNEQCKCFHHMTYVRGVRFGANARNLDKSALHPGPGVLK
jgi:hypothetical protein